VIASALSLLKKPVGFRVFSQFTGHYLYRESKRAIIYAHSKVIGLTGKRKPQFMTIMRGPGGSDHVVCHGLLHTTIFPTPQKDKHGRFYFFLRPRCPELVEKS
jgi:hypothetical protein